MRQPGLHIGRAADAVTLVVVCKNLRCLPYSRFDSYGEKGKIRIISCRKATAHEMIIMKKAKIVHSKTADDMRPEYDFSTMKGGVRGKYYKAFREGHQVIIHKEDGAVMLEPNLRKYFPTSEAVNKALRSLIEIVPTKKRASSSRKL